ncbi:MAG: aldose 1-epimerase family protein [Chthonomonadales bacterium]
MAELFGRRYTREELLAHVGDISQIARVKPYRLVEGHEDGVAAMDVATGGGLTFTVLTSRGMDISAASYNGRSLAWRSATTDQHPAFFEPEGRGWLRTFYGGLVLTCGLTWMGAACEDEGRPLGLHGRISHIPATNVHWEGSWEGDDYVLTVSGRMREAIVFGENVELHRTIRARLGETRFFLHDRVRNMGYQRTPHMMLYHINIGFPIVDDHSRLIAPSITITPRDEDAVEGKEQYAQMQPPTPGFREKVYFHDLLPDAEGMVTTAIVNPACDGGLGVFVTYPKHELPFFTEWKMMDQGTYVVGMEPGNALVLGRAAERAAGRLQFLEPGEEREYHLEIGVITEGIRIRQLEDAAAKAPHRIL